MEIAPLHLHIRDSSGPGEARRAAADLARRIGFNETDVGRVSLVATESASNLVKHAGGGEMVMATQPDPAASVDVLALDHGPGIANIAHAARDGFSTFGSPGNGLGAIARVASEFDIYSQPGAGTVVFARIATASSPARTGAIVGAVNVPIRGETVSGDGWDMHRNAGRVTLVVVDGLGHGQLAHDAAHAATTTFRARPDGAPVEILERIHDALRPTRGAAVGVAEVDLGQRAVRFAGIGNIAGTIMQNGSTHSVVSHHGTAGHHARRLQEFTYKWPAGATLVLHSDGLLTNWTLAKYPGLSDKHPILTAALLYRDFRRGRDDTTVVVLRERA